MLVAGFIFAALAAGSLNRSSFFLLFDNPTQHLAGWLFLHGQWAYSGNKALIMWIMAGLTRLAGANPLNETVFLSLLGIGASMAFADLAYMALGQRRWALLSMILWLGLGTTLFYFRTHIGYPLAFYVIGLALYVRRHFTVAGICLLLAVLAHTSFVVPVFLWVGVTTLLGIGPHTVLEWIGLATPMMGMYLTYEYIALRFTTEIWHTAKNFLSELHLLDTIIYPDHPLGYLWFLFKAANGIPATWCLTFSLFVYPISLLLRRPANRLHVAFYFASIPLVIYLFVRSGVNHRITVLRPLAGSIPLLIIIAVYLLAQCIRWLHQRSRVATRFAGVVLSLVVVWHTTQSALEITRCSTTAYPAVQEAFERAAAQQIPVVFFGNAWIGAYYRAVSGATALIQPNRPALAYETANALSLTVLPPSSSLIVIWAEDGSPDATLAPLEAAGGPTLQPNDVVARIAHPVGSCPVALVEGRDATIARLRAAHPLEEATQPPDSDVTILIWQTVP